MPTDAPGAPGRPTPIEAGLYQHQEAPSDPTQRQYQTPQFPPYHPYYQQYPNHQPHPRLYPHAAHTHTLAPGSPSPSPLPLPLPLPSQRADADTPANIAAAAAASFRRTLFLSRRTTAAGPAAVGLTAGLIMEAETGRTRTRGPGVVPEDDGSVPRHYHIGHHRAGSHTSRIQHRQQPPPYHRQFQQPRQHRHSFYQHQRLQQQQHLYRHYLNPNEDTNDDDANDDDDDMSSESESDAEVSIPIGRNAMDGLPVGRNAMEGFPGGGSRTFFDSLSDDNDNNIILRNERGEPRVMHPMELAVLDRIGEVRGDGDADDGEDGEDDEAAAADEKRIDEAIRWFRAAEGGAVRRPGVATLGVEPNHDDILELVRDKLKERVAALAEDEWRFESEGKVW